MTEIMIAVLAVSFFCLVFIGIASVAEDNWEKKSYQDKIRRDSKKKK